MRAFSFCQRQRDVLNENRHLRLMCDHLANGDLRRVRDELLDCRVFGLSRRVEETRGSDDALAGFHQEVALEARQFAQLRNQAVVDLAAQLFMRL